MVQRKRAEKLKTRTRRNPKTLVIIPAWNEHECIGEVLDEIKTGYSNLDILVVDDGSEDATAKIARKKGARVVSHLGNQGVVAAIQTGRIYALEHDYDFIVFCDADGQHNPSDIGKITAPLARGEADFVIGSRELGQYACQEPRLLKIPRWFCSQVTSIMLRRRITDPTSGFKGWNRRVIRYLKTVYKKSNKLHLSTTNGIEEILLAAKAGLRINEVPVKMLNRRGGEPKIYTSHNIFYFLTVFPWHLIRTVSRNL